MDKSRDCVTVVACGNTAMELRPIQFHRVADFAIHNRTIALLRIQRFEPSVDYLESRMISLENGINLPLLSSLREVRD